MRIRLLTFLLALALSGHALAQEMEPLPEGLQIGLSTDNIFITSDFSGADLSIFGALENPNTQVLRQGRYDVVVVLEGPPRPTVVRRKTLVLVMRLITEAAALKDVTAA